jgi:hypothetical protein
MQRLNFPVTPCDAQRSRVASLHAGQQRRRFGLNSLAKHAPPAPAGR